MRTTTSSHPLAKLRAIVGWSREDCAAVCGMTAANVQNIELGRAPLSEKAALRIQAATGCLGASLSNTKKTATPIGLDGETFTKAKFEKWTKCAVSDLELDLALNDYAFRVQTLLRAVRNEPAKFRQLCTLLNQEMFERPDDLGVSTSELNEIARKDAVTRIGWFEFQDLIKMFKGHAIEEVSIREIFKAIEIGANPDAPDALYSNLLEDLEAALQGKDTTKWQKKECQFVIKCFKNYPRLKLAGGYFLATSYNSLRLEFDIVLPDKSNISIHRQYVQVPVTQTSKGEVETITMKLLLPEGSE